MKTAILYSGCFAGYHIDIASEEYAFLRDCIGIKASARIYSSHILILLRNTKMLIKYNDNLVLNKASFRYSDKNNEKNAKATVLMQYTEKNRTVSFQVRVDVNGHLTLRTHEDWIPEEVFTWFFNPENVERIRTDIINTILFSQQIKQSDLIDLTKSVIKRMYEFNNQEYCSKLDRLVQEFLDVYEGQFLISAKEPVYFSEFVRSIVTNAEMPVEEQIEHIAVIFATNATIHKVNILGRALYQKFVEKPLPF